MWVPKRWDLSLAALSQYTTPQTPPENPWVDRPRTPVSDSAANPNPSASSSPTVKAPSAEPPVKARPKRRPPSRRLVRHVLRARVEAVKALAEFFDQLDRLAGSKRLKASTHLAKIYGGSTQPEVPGIEVESGSELQVEGWRDVREVIDFLKKRGAKVPTLGRAAADGEWAALSSEGEGDSYTTNDEDEMEPVWVPTSSND